MRRHLGLAALTAAFAMAGASAAQAPIPRNDICWLQCRYECYVTNPAGTPAWERCYLDCGYSRCVAG